MEYKKISLEKYKRVLPDLVPTMGHTGIFIIGKRQRDVLEIKKGDLIEIEYQSAGERNRDPELKTVFKKDLRGIRDYGFLGDKGHFMMAIPLRKFFEIKKGDNVHAKFVAIYRKK